MLGSASLIIHDTGCRVDVSGFANALGLIELPIIMSAAAYGHPITSKVYILVLNQGIHCRLMDNHMLCPMQCHVNGVVINETPKICTVAADNLAHSIVINNPLEPEVKLHISLQMCGITSCFNVCCPSTAEFEDEDILKIEMTSKLPHWNPADLDWAAQEALTMDSRGRVHDVKHVITTGRRFINLVSTSELAVNFTTNNHFHDALWEHVNVSQVEMKNGHCSIDYEKLADK